MWLWLHKINTALYMNQCCTLLTVTKSWQAERERGPLFKADFKPATSWWISVSVSNVKLLCFELSYLSLKMSVCTVQIFLSEVHLNKLKFSFIWNAFMFFLFRCPVSVLLILLCCYSLWAQNMASHTAIFRSSLLIVDSCVKCKTQHFSTNQLSHCQSSQSSPVLSGILRSRSAEWNDDFYKGFIHIFIEHISNSMH